MKFVQCSAAACFHCSITSVHLCSLFGFDSNCDRSLCLATNNFVMMVELSTRTMLAALFVLVLLVLLVHDSVDEGVVTSLSTTDCTESEGSNRIDWTCRCSTVQQPTDGWCSIESFHDAILSVRRHSTGMWHCLAALLLLNRWFGVTKKVLAQLEVVDLLFLVGQVSRRWLSIH